MSPALATAASDSGARVPAPGLSLSELARLIPEHAPVIEGDAEVRVSGVRQDSRNVEPGELFAARAGAQVDGGSYAEQAVHRGASAVLVEHERQLPALAVPVLRVQNVRLALAKAAEAVLGFPSRALSVVGVTGTNGKTTTTFLIEHALAELGARPARLGTLGLALPGASGESAHTTPEADEVSRAIARAFAASATHFVMEVSSHALTLDRVAALSFEVAAFTNLTQDHLDFHRSMAEYGSAKARLFHELSPRASVVVVDEPFGRELAATARGRVTTVSTKRVAADVNVENVTFDERGIRADVLVNGARARLASGLVGAHNLENLLVSLGVLLALGVEPEPALAALGSAPAVPGRLERCDGPADDVLVVVDYAHTPDALERVLSALRPITRGKLCCVFGCGGDRDPGKRPKMGSAVGARADRAIVTNDNPRTESPESIARAIVEGLEPSGVRFEVELDRAAAIERAIASAASGDTVLIAGKGHEDYQIFGAEKRPFDDRTQARRALELRRSGPGSRS